MLLAKNSLSKADHIAKELLDDQALEMASRCESVERTVSGGAFSLARALRLYKVPMETYIEYIALQHANSFAYQLNEDSRLEELTIKLIAAEKLLQAMFDQTIAHEDLLSLLEMYGNFSKRVIRKQELVK